MSEIKPVAWIVGNVSFGPYDFRKTEPHGWRYSEPLIKLSEHRAAIDALQARIKLLESANIAYSQQVAELIGRAGNAEVEVERLEALISECRELLSSLEDISRNNAFQLAAELVGKIDSASEEQG